MSRNKAYEKGLDAYGQFVLVREQVIDMKKNQKLLEKKRKREGMSDNEIAFEVEETAVILGDLEKKAEKLKEKMMNLFTKSIDGKYSEEMFEDINLMTHDVQKRMDPMDSNPMDSDLNKTFLEAMTQFDNFDRSRDALKALRQEIDSIKRSGSTSTDSKLRQTTERFENLKENCKMQQKIVRDLLKNAYAVENDSEKRIDIQALMSSLEMFDPDNWQGHNKSVPKVKNRSATFLAPKIPSPKPVQAPRGLRSVKKHKSRLQLPSRVKPSLYGMTHSVELAKNEARREKLLKPPVKNVVLMKKSFVEQPKTEKPMTPLASLKKPATKNAQMNPLLNRTQLQVYTSNKVRETVQQLEDIKDKEIRTEPKIKAKFDTFVNNFCSLYCQNHNSKRFDDFSEYRKVFHDNIEEILGDLEEFYMVLPYNEGKSFDKEAHKSQFYVFLQTLYRQTKDLMVDKNICKKVVVSKLEASTQIGKMKILENSIKKFIAAVEQLLRPYVTEAAGEKPHLLSIMGPSQASNLRRTSIKNISKSFKQPAPPKTVPIPSKEIKKQSAIPSRVINNLRPASTPAHKTVEKTFVGGGDQQSKELTSLSKILQAVKKISNSFCHVITNAATLKADFIDNALYESIQRLKILFEESLFGGDDAAFPKEMNEISEDFFNLKVLRFTNVLKGQRVDKSVCQKILENKFNHSKLPFSDIRRIAADFYMRLVQFQSKYIRKYTAKEEKNLTAAQMKGLEQTIGVSPIKTRVPKVVASKLKTNIHVAPSKIARSAIPRNV